jgi:ribonuclease BN (tRNA processing enzyme)
MSNRQADDTGRGMRRRQVLTAGVASAVGMGLAAGFPATAAAGGRPPARSDEFALVALGTKGGPPPSAEMSGISTALVVNGKTYIVDCGRGSLTQFVRAGLDVGSLAGFFLTHLHMDHIVDYISYLELCAGYTSGAIQKPMFCYGPGSPGPLGDPPAGYQWLYEKTPGTSEMTTRLLEAYGTSANLFEAERSSNNSGS